MKLIDTKDAEGTVLCHDITQIIRGVTKDARFRKGHIVTKEDIPVLFSLGKEHLYVWEQTPGMIHENEAAVRLLKICKNEYMHETPVKEGKIELISGIDGLFCVNSAKLIKINSLENIMIATRHGGTSVQKGDKLAGFRIIPLVIEEKQLDAADAAAGTEPILAVHPWSIKTAAVITTGSEVYKGLIQDTFTPVIEAKLAAFGISVIFHERCDDDMEGIKTAISKACKSGAGMILCTGGMSVDPDDRTPGAIRASGAAVVTYGAPVLPGAMLLIGYLDSCGTGTVPEAEGSWDEEVPAGIIPILGLPGCVMYASSTVFDIVLPKIIAGRRITKQDIVTLGEGGLCPGCRECTFPNCGFGK
jgi:hypothetical protein